MCTACIDDDVEEGTVDLQTGENLPVFSVVMDDGQIITSETLKGCLLYTSRRDADLYIVALKDAVLRQLAPVLVKGREQALFCLLYTSRCV